VGENILDKKRLELLSKSDDFDTGFNNSGLAIEDYLLVRIRNSDLFAKLYLYVCKNISQNKIKFSPVNIDYNKCGCGHTYVYRFFNELVNLRYFSINKVAKVNTYVLTIPVMDFITIKRLEAANKRLGI